MEFDWQSVLHVKETTADNGTRRLAAPTLNRGEKIVGYMLSPDAGDKVVSVNGVDIDKLKRSSGNSFVCSSSSPTVDIIYRSEYLANCPSKRVVKCLYYPKCNCCVEERLFEFSDDEGNSLPRGFNANEEPFARHTVDGPTVWALGSYRR